MKNIGSALAGLALVASPVPLFAQAPSSAVPRPAVQVDVRASLAAAIRQQARGSIKAFYAKRNYDPIWTDGRLIGADAQVLLHVLDDAKLDGLKPARYRADKLRAMIADADNGDAKDVAKAELALSEMFARYVSDVRKVKKTAFEYADPALKPEKLGAERILRVAASTDSFSTYMRTMGWMSPLYVHVREAMRAGLAHGADSATMTRVIQNRERARLLPPPTVRHIVVDVASARLWYYQAGNEAGSMKVVVGAKETPTPLMAGSLNYAILNPYWNIPDYLVTNSIAKKVLSGRTLASMHMEALSDWSPSAVKLDPKTIDWKAVAENRRAIRIRELPGPHNSMGAVKFLFPNEHGIYLHDSPNRPLFGKDDRHLSNGCIRLEKAWVLGKWMMGKALAERAKKAGAEEPMPFAAPVPVYLTYITTLPAKDGVRMLPDVYGIEQTRR